MLRLMTVQGRGGPMTLVGVRDNMTGWTRGPKQGSAFWVEGRQQQQQQ